MKPLELKLKNFIGIKSGLGVDEININIAELTDDARIVALQGENGKGKSTILDNLHPYRLMPSRSSSYSPGSFSYYDNTYGDAEKVLIWEHCGFKYSSLIKIKGQNKTKKTEAYLFEYNPICNEWAVCDTGDGGTSDGKTVTYDKAVEHVLGSPEMFFTAVFSSQGKKPLSNYTNGDIKTLMSELLGMESIAELGEYASDVVKGLSAHVTGFAQSLSLVKDNQAELDSASESLDRVSAKIGMDTIARDQAKRNVADAAERLARIRLDAGDMAAIDDKRKMLNEQLQSVIHAADKRIEELRVDMDRLNKENESNESTHKSEIEKIRVSLSGLQESRFNYEKVIEQRDDIQQAIVRLASLDEMKHSNDELIQDAQAAVATLDKYTAAINSMNNELVSLKSQASTVCSHIENLTKQAELVGQVPCDGMDIQAGCPLLSNALTAENLISAQQSELESLYEKQKEIETRINNGKASIEDLGPVSDHLLSLKNAKVEIQAEYIETKKLADKMSQLEVAESALKGIEDRLEDLAVHGDEINSKYNAEKLKIDGLLSGLSEKFRIAEFDRLSETETLQEQINQLPNNNSGDVLQDAKEKHAAAEKIYFSFEDAVNEGNADAATLKARISVLQDGVDQAGKIKRKIEIVNDEIAAWKVLAKGLGKDGIIALSIDDAGPTISSLANDILLKCYGPRFTVSIDTQSQTASGSLRETFDIMVFDGERNEKKSIKTMSGGERVWINECITRAIALYQLQQSGQAYGCLFTDETDGALDPDRKVMFMKMKQTVLDLGGYEKEFFITHTPELLDLADAVIDLSQFEGA